MLEYEAMGKVIRAKRKEMKLTQKDLANRVGISTAFCGHIERGSRKASLETVVAIANVLELSLDKMLQSSLSVSPLNLYEQGIVDNVIETLLKQRNILSGYKASPSDRSFGQGQLKDMNPVG